MDRKKDTLQMNTGQGDIYLAAKVTGKSQLLPLLPEDWLELEELAVI